MISCHAHGKGKAAGAGAGGRGSCALSTHTQDYAGSCVAHLSFVIHHQVPSCSSPEGLEQSSHSLHLALPSTHCHHLAASRCCHLNRDVACAPCCCCDHHHIPSLDARSALRSSSRVWTRLHGTGMDMD